MSSERGTLRVGRLARESKISIRTLHYYDEIGLVSPRRTRSGQRVYGPEEILRLQQVLSLRQLGLPLEEIRRCLRGSRFSPRRVLRLHLSRLRRQVDAGRRLCATLESLLQGLSRGGTVSVAKFIRTIKEIAMYEKHYTPEQLRSLQARAENLGPERLREVQEEWPKLIAAVRAEMAKGTDPSSPAARKLATRWKALVAEFSGGDAGIERSLGNFYRQEPQAAPQNGLDREIFAYVEKAGRA